MTTLQYGHQQMGKGQSVGVKREGQSQFGSKNSFFDGIPENQSESTNYGHSLIPEFSSDFINNPSSNERSRQNTEEKEKRKLPSRQKRTPNLPQNALMIHQTDQNSMSKIKGGQISKQNSSNNAAKGSKFQRKVVGLEKEGMESMKPGLFVGLKDEEGNVGDPFIKINLADGFEDKNTGHPVSKINNARQNKSTKVTPNKNVFVVEQRGRGEKGLIGSSSEDKKDKTSRMGSRNSSTLILEEDRISPTTTNRFEDIAYRCAYIRNYVRMGQVCEFSFKREKTWYHSLTNPQYTLSLKSGDFVMNARKQFGYFNSYYHITANQKDYQGKGEAYLGYIQGNFTGSEFNLYQNNEGVNEIVATVYYGSQFSCSSLYRQIEVYVKNPSVGDIGDEDSRRKSLKEFYDSDQNVSRRVMRLVTKEPQWNEKHNCFILNLRGKSRYGSIKNMVLIEEENPQDYIMMFCKDSEHGFHLEVSNPLSPFVGMGIILSSFDFKLCTQ